MVKAGLVGEFTKCIFGLLKWNLKYTVCQQYTFHIIVLLQISPHHEHVLILCWVGTVILKEIMVCQILKVSSHISYYNSMSEIAYKTQTPPSHQGKRLDEYNVI